MGKAQIGRLIPLVIVAVLSLMTYDSCRSRTESDFKVDSLSQIVAGQRATIGLKQVEAESLKQEITERGRTIAGLKSRARWADQRFDSLLATWPLEQAPRECIPYVKQVLTCQLKVAQRDSIIKEQDLSLLDANKRGDVLQAAIVIADSALDTRDKQLHIVRSQLHKSRLMVPLAAILGFLLAKL